MAFKRVKGTLDFYPEDLATQRAVFDKLREVANSYGFSEVEAPAMESMDLLTAKAGEEIKTQIFTLEKQGKESLGLRFELTASLARMFVDVQKSSAKPVKWFGLSRMWRYEAPQKGRLREFYQLSVELFGSNKPEADAEVISLAVDCLKAFGLTEKDFFIKLNNRKLLQGLLKDIVPDYKMENAIRIIDKKTKVSPEDFEKEYNEAGFKDFEKFNEILELKDLKSIKSIKKNKLATEGYNELKEVYDKLDEKFIEIDLSTARGLAYYTSTVFEIFDRDGKFRSIAGGGRYDEMVELFGGQPTPATGFAIGYATLSLLLEEKGRLPKIDISSDYFIAIIGDVKDEAFKLAKELREKGKKVDIDIMQRKLGKQFEYADTIKAKKVIVVGEDEVKSKKFKAKDMASGEEETLNRENL